MNTFKYTAIDSTGKRIAGEKEANTKEEVVNFLQSKNLIIVNIDEKLSAQFQNLFSTDIGGLPLKEKVLLTKQLSTMVSANIPIIQAIDILVQQAERPSVKTKLQNVYKSIEAGTSLSEAFRKEKGIFSEVHINLLAAGEKSANLNEMLSKIAADLESSRNLRGKITGALIYPIIIFIVMIVVILVMLTTMIPQVKELYHSLGQDTLPFATEILVNLGSALNNATTLAVIVVIVVAGFILFRYANATKKGKENIDSILLRIPIFGGLIQKAELALFCRLSAMLMGSGLQIIETMTIVGNASTNQIFKNIIMQAKEEIIKGSSVSVSIAKFNKEYAFPIILVKMIATGEESGKLDQVLSEMSVFYDNEVDQMASSLTKLMEPLIMIVAGGMVAFLAIAVYLPIFQVGQLVKS